MRFASIVSLCLAVVVIWAGSAGARRFVPGPYHGRSPSGIVAGDNILRIPPHAHGVVMLIHGGAWVMVGPRTLETAEEPWFHAHGWGTYDVDYRGGWDALADVMAAYDHLRHVVGPRTPICLQGQSAGATMAMLVAAHRSVACVVSEAGIVDLTKLPARERFLLNKYVFRHHLWAFSPVREASLIRAPLLMAGSSLDRIVPERRQMREMRRARARTATMLLRGAAAPAWAPNFPHAGVRPRALHRFHRAVARLLVRAARGWGPSQTHVER